MIIPSYNYKSFLATAVDSALKQILVNIEVVIVDDGSKEDVFNYVKKLAQLDRRIKVFWHQNHKNLGLSKTITLGIQKSQYSWIAILEADDAWQPNCLVERFRCCSKETDLIINNIKPMVEKDANRDWFDSYVPRICKKLKKLQKQETYELLKTEIFWENLVPTFSCTMFKKELAEKINWNSPVSAWTDWYVWIQMFQKGHISYCDYKLTNWRLHPSSQNSKKNFLTYIKQYRYFRNQLLKENVSSTIAKSSRINPLKLPFFIPLARRLILGTKEVGLAKIVKSIISRLKR